MKHLPSLQAIRRSDIHFVVGAVLAVGVVVAFVACVHGF